jgi:hypothetical protein
MIHKEHTLFLTTRKSKTGSTIDVTELNTDRWIIELISRTCHDLKSVSWPLPPLYDVLNKASENSITELAEHARNCHVLEDTNLAKAINISECSFLSSFIVDYGESDSPNVPQWPPCENFLILKVL